MIEKNGMHEVTKYCALILWAGKRLTGPFATPAGFTLIFLGNIDFYCAFLYY